jgi:hypothetical protein
MFVAAVELSNSLLQNAVIVLNVNSDVTQTAVLIRFELHFVFCMPCG